MADIIIMAEQRRGELNPICLEMIGAATEIKQNDECQVIVAVIAEDPSEFTPAFSVEGVDEVITVKSPVSEFQPDLYTLVARQIIESRNPSLVFIPHSVDGIGYAAAICEDSRFGLVTDVFAMHYEGDKFIATRAGFKEKVHMDLEFPGKEVIILTVRGGVFKPGEGQASPRIIDVDPPVQNITRNHLEFIEPAASSDIDISQSEFILSIGRGVDDEADVEKFSELAELLGSTLCCSRPIADNGWLPKSRQVGQSGKTATNCKLYIAMGISGSIQHLAGMKHIENIIAVNTDPEASIFSVAKYGVVADIFDIADELRNHFE